MSAGASVASLVRVGVAKLAVNDTPSELIDHADQAMYDAKRLGKNKVGLDRRAQERLEKPASQITSVSQF
jgi:PleD family two-component response regulator